MKSIFNDILTCVCVIICLFGFVFLNRVDCTLNPIQTAFNIQLNSINWKSGDLILFETNPYIQMGLQQYITHVGICVINNQNEPLLLEISPQTKIPKLSHINKTLSNILITNPHKIIYRQISQAIPISNINDFLKSKDFIWYKYKHTSYIKAFITRILSKFKLIFYTHKRKKI